MCKGFYNGSPTHLPEAYRRLMREEYRSLVPPPPWIMRGDNALISLWLLLGLAIGAMLARYQWGI